MGSFDISLDLWYSLMTNPKGKIGSTDFVSSLKLSNNNGSNDKSNSKKWHWKF